MELVLKLLIHLLLQHVGGLVMVMADVLMGQSRACGVAGCGEWWCRCSHGSEADAAAEVFWLLLIGREAVIENLRVNQSPGASAAVTLRHL